MGDKDLVPHNVELPAIGDDMLIEMAKKAEQRVAAIQKIKQTALSITNSMDWVDQNGRPYLQASGAEKIARLFSISWRLDQPIMENDVDNHFIYKVKGEFSMAGASIEVIGTRSSKDGFFTRGGKLTADQIDSGDVMKAAITNCLGNGITRLLGIRNLTYEDLAKYAKISQSQIGKVEYNSKAKKEPIQQPQSTQQGQGQQGQQGQSDTNATPPQIRAIQAILGKLGITDDFEKHEHVSTLLGLSEVVESFNMLTKNQASQAIDLLGKEQDEQGGR